MDVFLLSVNFCVDFLLFRKTFVLKDGTTGFVLWTFPVYRWSLGAYSELGEICARAAVFLDISG